MQLFSPAKINLFLRIVSKRSDGYHNLSSVFQTIDLGDTLTIESHEQDVFTCTDSQLPTDASNLVQKALKLFRLKTGNQQPFKIHLDKRIPTQAGLGGGSSNAATTLWACNKLTGNRVPLETLKQWGSEIGSDVPFFLSQGTAYCTGRGEHVHHLPAFAKTSLWIIKPSQGLSTPAVYGQLKLTNSLFEKTCQRDLDTFLSGSLTYFNDLEAPAFEIQPQLKELKQTLLSSGFHTVMMSGSGSAFFCIGEGEIPTHPDFSCFQAQFVNRTLGEWYREY